MMGLLKRWFNPGEAGCAETRKLASDYLADDLAPQKQSAIRHHLSRCGPCRAFVETLGITIGLLNRLPRVTAPDSLKRRIVERTEQGNQSASG